MNRLLILLVLFILIPSAAFSQLGIKAGLGANVTFPASDLGDFVSTGFGGTGMLKFGLIPLIDVTAGLEYIKFTEKDVSGGTGNGHAWGYFAGGRVAVFVMAYAGLELGGYSLTSEFEAPSVPSTSNTNTKFFYAPMAGVSLGMFDANLRYVVADGSNFVSLRGMIWF